jgi:hypothetical protein
MPEIPNVRFSCGNSNIRDLLQILATEIQTNFNNSKIQGAKVSMQMKGLVTEHRNKFPRQKNILGTFKANHKRVSLSMSNKRK